MYGREKYVTVIHKTSSLHMKRRITLKITITEFKKEKNELEHSFQMNLAGSNVFNLAPHPTNVRYFLFIFFINYFYIYIKIHFLAVSHLHGYFN